MTTCYNILSAPFPKRYLILAKFRFDFQALVECTCAWMGCCRNFSDYMRSWFRLNIPRVRVADTWLFQGQSKVFYSRQGAQEVLEPAAAAAWEGPTKTSDLILLQQRVFVLRNHSPDSVSSITDLKVLPQPDLCQWGTSSGEGEKVHIYMVYFTILRFPSSF